MRKKHRVRMFNLTATELLVLPRFKVCNTVTIIYADLHLC
jgi:hypothetical protein